MAFNDLEFHAVKKEVEAFVESRRPPVHIRPELDITYKINNQTIGILEVRPQWNGESGEMMEHPVAKITYVRSQKAWNVYWMRASLKWELYEKAKTLGNALEIVRTDQHGCFFG
ncbi:DUF3024 domain-containing protein [Serratia inhibens]|uniref:DUF3024 domain-containing protein n=1 Tax=Serratia inhibens TaxID=2338073 RepID=UPI000809805A|nr:DUF3024 domain-containing protein [Serratia inhibens]ANS41637.1 hypothetical protein Q5A_005775 [Serratia inhibens PRI-2C]